MKQNETSLLGFNYSQKNFDERLALTIKQKHDLPEVICNLLAGRGLSCDEVGEFLDPKLKTSLPNPFDLLDMDLAVDFVVKAILQNKKITIFADYDVDGATSSASLKRFFASIGVAADIYIPDRILEGYGPNVEALLNLKKKGTDLVITLDCGTVAFEPLEAAKKAGLDVIVIDHHIGAMQKPDAIAVINPNRIDEKFPHKNLCAAGVCFLFIVAINKKLRELNFYQSKKEPNLMNLLDLVALGTVCDVMSLTGVNRALVAQGLKILKQRKNPGLRKICDLAGIDSEPSSYHFGFVIGPRINAGGRVGKSDLGARILSSENDSEIEKIAQQLEEFNIQRKDIEAQVLEESIALLETNKGQFKSTDSVIFAAGKNWHPGVIGIVASRLKDKFNKPTAVIAIDENGKGKASCRSINGIDFGAQILNARANDLVIEGGGHAMAGGFSVDENKINELHQFFCQKMAKDVEILGAQRNKDFDIALELPQINLDLLKDILALEPFGVGNAKPTFLVKNLQKLNAKIIGKTGEHISCNFSCKGALGFSGNLQAVAFKAAENEIGQLLLDQKYKKPLNVIGSLNINSWMGVEKVQLIIEDILL